MAPRVKRFILVVFVFVLAIFLAARFSDSLQGTDYPDFYCAARMVVEGHGHQLYDAELLSRAKEFKDAYLEALKPRERPEPLAAAWAQWKRGTPA